MYTIRPVLNKAHIQRLRWQIAKYYLCVCICFRSLSCWKINLWSRFNLLLAVNKLWPLAPKHQWSTAILYSRYYFPFSQTCWWYAKSLISFLLISTQNSICSYNTSISWHFFNCSSFFFFKHALLKVLDKRDSCKNRFFIIKKTNKTNRMGKTNHS